MSQPGSLDGGGLPNDFSNPDLPLSLSLVPPGVTPVSVFPPFANEPIFPAVGVIFTENSQLIKRRGNYRRGGGGGYFNRMQETILNWRRNLKCYGPKRCNPYNNPNR